MDILGWILWSSWMVGIILGDYLALRYLWYEYFHLKEWGWTWYENVRYECVEELFATGYLWGRQHER